MPPHAYVHQVDQPKLDMFLVAQAEDYLLLTVSVLIWQFLDWRLRVRDRKKEAKAQCM
jgi:hypothetical protein